MILKPQHVFVLATVSIFSNLVAGSSLAASAKVSFKNIHENAVLGSETKVEFVVEGMTVQPAGAITAGTGHHHLIVDSPAIPKGQVVPMDEKHLHFGKGQTETVLKLKPGKHTLTLQFADGAHMSYGSELSSTVHVTVK